MSAPLFERTLSELWVPKEGVNFEGIGRNRFLIKFFHRTDFNRVWNGAPWTFSNKLVAMRELKEEEDPLMMEITSTPIWVQITRVPRTFVSTQMCEAVGKFVGELMEIDENNFNVLNPRYLRVRVMVAIKKPLKKKMSVRVSAGKTFQVDFRYERLLSFCLICGLMEH